MPPQPVRVLHVDDDGDFAAIVATHLEREDPHIEILTANRAKAGLERLEEADVDCIVSDYQMPGMDGLAFLRAVREEYPALPFVLYTARESQELVREALAAGADEFVQKSTGCDQYTVLADRVRDLVEQYRTRRDTV